MKVNKLEELRALSPAAAEFVEKFDPDTVADGRYELGGGCYVNVQTFQTKMRKDATFESHERYIDVQLLASGEELDAVTTRDEVRIKTPYNETKDVTKYYNDMQGIDYVLTAGNYLVFDPSQVHMPGINCNGVHTNRKLVIKIPVK